MNKTKVVVTGGCGFVGREVVRQLIEKGYFVVVLDNFSNSSPLKDSESLIVINLDLIKEEGIADYFKDAKYCIHLAASVGGIKYMNEFRSEILANDILIDLNVIRTASISNTKLVYASTVIVYDQQEVVPYKEDVSIVVPKSNYGFSKLIGERLCQVFAEDKDLVFSIARICNIYGVNPNKLTEKKLHVIPDLTRKILQEKTLQLIGGGRQTRTFVHVMDVAEALILMMESSKSNNEIFNIGSEDSYQIIEVAKMIWNLIKVPKPFYSEDISIEGSDFIKSIVDISKINNILGWKAKKVFKETLPEVVEWYKDRYGEKVFQQ